MKIIYFVFILAFAPPPTQAADSAGTSDAPIPYFVGKPLYDSDIPVSEKFPVGVVDAPCAHIPDDASLIQNNGTQPTVPDFGQICRYAEKNTALLAKKSADDRIVFMGDSITQGWGDNPPPKLGMEVVNRGISGETTSQMLLRFKSDVLDLKPKAVHILAGTNDIAGNTGPTSLTRIQGNVQMMAEIAKARGIQVVLASVLPATKYFWNEGVDPMPSIKAMNAWLKKYAADNGFTFVDYYHALGGDHGLPAKLSPDAVHLKQSKGDFHGGYDIMNDLLADALKRLPKFSGKCTNSNPISVYEVDGQTVIRSGGSFQITNAKASFNGLDELKKAASIAPRERKLIEGAISCFSPSYKSQVREDSADKAEEKLKEVPPY